jgi:hypothetical protein
VHVKAGPWMTIDCGHAQGSEGTKLREQRYGPGQIQLLCTSENNVWNLAALERV